MRALPARRTALLFLAIGTISFGFSGVLIKLCAFPPPVIASGRMLLAGAVLTPFCLPGLKRLVRERGLVGLLLLVLPGLLLGLHFHAWVAGLKRTSVASATFIFSVNPVFFALFERFLFRKTVRAYTYVSLGLALAGAYWLLAVKGGRLGQTGDILCFIATLLFVVYLLASRRVSEGVPHLVYIHLIYLWGGLLTLPLAFLWAQPASLSLSDTRSLLALAALALFPTLVGHTSSNYGVRHLPALTVSFFSLTEPVFATVSAALVLGEIPSPREFPAYFLFLAAVVFYLWRSRRGPP